MYHKYNINQEEIFEVIKITRHNFEALNYINKFVVREIWQITLTFKSSFGKCMRRSNFSYVFALT